MHFHLLSSSWLLRACTGIEGKVCVPSLMAWWQFEKGMAGWILLFVLVADWIWSNSARWLLIGDTVLATMPYPTSKIRQASRVVEDPLQCLELHLQRCIRGFIGAGWQRLVCGAFDRFLAIGSSRSTKDINRGYPAAYQPKGWCHRAGRSLPTSGKHLTSPCQSDDDPWHLQQ